MGDGAQVRPIIGEPSRPEPVSQGQPSVQLLPVQQQNVQGLDDQFANDNPVSGREPPRLSTPPAVRLQQVAPQIDRHAPRFQEMVSVARDFYRNLETYPALMQQGYTLVYGPLADLAPADQRERDRSTMWNLHRIHSWRKEAVALFGLLTVAKTREDQKGVFFIKHAIGYGSLDNQRLETMNEPPRDHRSLERIRHDFYPFRKIVEGAAPGSVGVMVAGAVVEALDPSSPAVLSPTVNRFIRQELGSRGEDVVLMTDDVNAPIFWPHILAECRRDENANICTTRDYGLNAVDRMAYLLARLVEGDVDIMLNYATPPTQVMADLFEAGNRLIQKGVISRAQLEKSVCRILQMKQTLYPDHPRLQDIQETVRMMSIEELLAQKIIVAGAWPVPNFEGPEFGSNEDGMMDQRFWPKVWMDNLKKISGSSPVGGVSLEGTKKLIGPVDQYVQTRLGEGAIPPFVCENPPLENGGFDNSGDLKNAQYRRETDPIRRLTELLDRYYPDGTPPGLIDAVYDE
ncbi:MAG: hypothetical protein Q7T11_02100, partial [Deltaproteobacteria bacterium]|nr:hypothetical protein [Deltaproteobacteria bacterium]